MNYYDYRFRVPMHHVDHAGVLFYANLFIHAHDAWEHFMRSQDADLAQLIADGQWRIPIVHAEADYTLPMRHGSEINIRLQIERLGRSSIGVVFIFIDQDGEQLAVARTTHVFVDAVANHSSEIPTELRTSLQRYTTN
jgi:YbgC/YbaW family acyl-CoA thioester hydrolase